MKIVYFILNRFDYDSRARLEVETLKSMGHDIAIVATVGGELKEYLGCPIHRIAQDTWPSRKIRFIQYNLKAASIGTRLAADIFHAVDLDTFYAARSAARKTGAKLIYESRELYTELEALAGRNTVRAFWRMLERRLIGKADKVITINGSIADELAKRYGIARPEVIRNVAPSTKSTKPVDLHSMLKIPSDHRIIIYQGILRSGQGLTYLLNLLTGLEKVTLVLIGQGPIQADLGKATRDLNIGERVRFVGMVPPDKLQDYTASGNAGVLFMEDAALNNRLALPQKLFQYLSAGIPQIVSPLPEIAGFVEREKTGIVVSLTDPQGDASKINEFLRDNVRYGAARDNCARSARENNWEIESQILIRIYRELERNK